MLRWLCQTVRGEGKRAMDKPKLNLIDFGSARERELLNRVHDTEFDRILRGEVNIPNSAGGEKFVGNARPLAQDAISAVFLRQRGTHKVVKPLP